MAVKGVDISVNNGSVDFQALKNAGVGFVLIRLGFGSDYTDQDDGQFEANVKKAEAAGIPWGAYLYSYALNENQAKSEARHALRVLNGRKPLYGCWFDMEDADGYKERNGMPSNSQLVRFCEVFCDAMEEAGLYSGVYASVSWLKYQLNSSKLDKYDKWAAQWNDECEYAKPYGIWQYTNSWVIGGKRFDGNWAYKDYPALVRAMNGEKEEPELTEAEVKKLARQEIETYFAELAKKPVANWAKEAVEFVQAEGLMNGDTDGSFRPQSFITRQEVAAVLMNEREK